MKETYVPRALLVRDDIEENIVFMMFMELLYRQKSLSDVIHTFGAKEFLRLNLIYPDATCILNSMASMALFFMYLM